MAPNPIVALVFSVVVGLWVTRFARNAYLNPDSTLQRWFSVLPQKDWARGILRGLSVFWIFGAILINLSAFARVVPFLNNHRGEPLMLVFVGAALIGTVLLVPRRKRRAAL